MERTLPGLRLCVVSRLAVGEELNCAGESAGIEGTLQGVQSSGEDEPRRVEGTVCRQCGAGMPSPAHFAAGLRGERPGKPLPEPSRAPPAQLLVQKAFSFQCLVEWTR